MMPLEAFHRGIYKVMHRGLTQDIHRNLTIIVEKLSEISLKIILSDENDPCFLCVMVLTRNDYEEMKKLQGLLVDFETFPHQFVKLLQHCDSGNMFLALHQDGPLNIYLEFIERNEFKKLVHLSLKTSPASDTDVKRNMSECILLLKKDVSSLESKLSSKESLFTEKEIFLEMRINDLNHVLSRANEEKNKREHDFQETIKKERERFEQEKIDLKNCIEISSKTQTLTMQETCTKKEKQLEDALSRCKQLQETIKSLESQIKDKSQRIYNLEKQLHTARMDIDSWKNENGNLDREYHDKEQNLQFTKNRLIDVEKALKDKSDKLRDTLDSLQTLTREKIIFEEKANLNETIASKKTLEVQNLNEQLLKANQIIAKQNADILELREKLMCRTAIAFEQEKVIENNNEDISKYQQREKEMCDEIDESKKKYIKMQEEVEAITKLLNEKSEVIKNNNSVIQWLHKKIDAVQSMNGLISAAGHKSISRNSAPFTHHLDSDLDEENNKLSNIYNAELCSNRPSSKKSKDEPVSEDGQFSVDPIYLKPCTYNSARTSTRSKSQGTNSKSTISSLDPKFNKENKESERSRQYKRDSYRVASSGISAYFPNHNR